ncbi:MAG: phytase [Phycisphaerales bacterium]
MNLITTAFLAIFLAAGAPLSAQTHADVAKQQHPVFQVTPVFETDPVESKGDAADDPAIWINRNDASKSLILGTDKKSGLAVYDLSGKIVQFLEVGRVNNVDLRTGLKLSGKDVTLAAATQRDDRSIVAWLIDEQTGTLTAAPGSPFKVGVKEPYGIALARAKREGALYVFVCDKESAVEQWLIEDNGHGTLSASLVRSFRIATQAEGMVADEEQGVLFICEEAKGVWKFPIDPSDTSQGTLIAGIKPDGPITPDAEGIAIAKGVTVTDTSALPATETSHFPGFIVVSSQGSNEYVVIDRTPPHSVLGTFSIGDSHTATGITIDGTKETDGLDVCTEPLGTLFPKGILVVQDGDNGKQPQNFKAVSLEPVIQKLTKPQR